MIAAFQIGNSLSVDSYDLNSFSVETWRSRRSRCVSSIHSSSRAGLEGRSVGRLVEQVVLWVPAGASGGCSFDKFSDLSATFAENLNFQNELLHRLQSRDLFMVLAPLEEVDVAGKRPHTSMSV